MIYLYITSLFFAFFPYISFVYTGTDIQPYSLIINLIIFSILIVRNKTIKMSFINFLFFVPVLLSLTLIIFSENKFSGFRSLYGYLNLSISLYVFLFIIRNSEKLYIRMLSISIYLWTAVGLIQTFFYRDFLFFLLPRSIEAIAISESRGVNSLAPEPTFYGIISIFLVLITATIPKEKLFNKNILIYLLLFSIILIAKSSMVILFLILYIIIYLLLHIFSLYKRPKIIILLLITIFFFINMDFSFLNGTRAYDLFLIAVEHPLEIAMLDASMNDRLSAIYFSMKGFITSFGSPHPYGEYSNYLMQEVPHSNYFWYITINDRIKSFYGGVLFELGIVGMIIFIGISYFLYRFYSYNIKLFLQYFLFVNAILFTAVPLSLSLIPLYLASLYKYQTKKESNSK